MHGRRRGHHQKGGIISQASKIDSWRVAVQAPHHQARHPGRPGLKHRQVADAGLIGAPAVVDDQHVAGPGPAEGLQEHGTVLCGERGRRPSAGYRCRAGVRDVGSRGGVHHLLRLANGSPPELSWSHVAALVDGSEGQRGGRPSKSLCRGATRTSGRHAQDRLAAGPLWQDHDLVFASTVGTPLDDHNVRGQFRVITEAAGLGKTWVPRELRHTCVSLLSAHGVPVEAIALLAGHNQTATTELVYRHQIVPALTRGAEVMDQIFG